MLTYNDIVEGIEKLKKRGFIKTHRFGPTGIGKTLEDELGLEENNLPEPDGFTTELMATRKDSGSMLSFFSKSPEPRGSNSELLKSFGYPGKNGKLQLYTTVNALEFNTIKGKTGFKIEISGDKVNLLTSKKSLKPYWKKETLRQVLEKKYYEFVYVKAESQGSGSSEQFHFNEAWLMKGFDFDNFVKLLRDGEIKVDFRIGQHSDGSSHDRGTGFRIFPGKLDLCFSKRKRIV